MSRVDASRCQMFFIIGFFCLLLLWVHRPVRAESQPDEALEINTADEEYLDSDPIMKLRGSIPFNYNRKGRRDPFVPLMVLGGDETIPSVASLTLTGVIWNHGESLAVLEDAKGAGYPMRVGDRLGNATLIGIKEDSAVFRIVLYGEVHMHTLELESKEEMRQ